MSKRKKSDDFHLYSFVSLHFIWNSNTVVSFVSLHFIWNSNIVVITVLEEETATEPSEDIRQDREKGNLAVSEDRN